MTDDAEPTAILVCYTTCSRCYRCGQECGLTALRHDRVAGAGGGRPGCGARFDRVTASPQLVEEIPDWRFWLTIVRPDLQVVDPPTTDPIPSRDRTPEEDNRVHRDWLGVAIALLRRAGGRVEFDVYGEELDQVRDLMNPRKFETQLVSYSEKLSNKMVVELRVRPCPTRRSKPTVGEING